MTTPSLAELLDDHQLYHSDFQMDHLITVRAGGTKYGCYKQALRELFKRTRGLRGLYADRALLLLDIEEEEERAQINRDYAGRSRTVKRAEIEAARKRLELDELDRNIADTEREFRRFYGQAVALKRDIGELTQEKRADLDWEMWRHRLKAMAAVDWITRGTLGENTVTFVASLPAKSRRGLLQEINDTAGLLKWFYEQDAQLPAVAEDDVELPALGWDVGLDLIGEGRSTGMASGTRTGMASGTRAGQSGATDGEETGFTTVAVSAAGAE